MNTETEPRGRVGVSVAPNQRKFVGLWEKKWEAAPAQSWIGSLRGEFAGALAVAKKYHDQIHAAQLAKDLGKPVEALEPHVREKRARDDLKMLGTIFQRANKIEDLAFVQRASLKPFDYDDKDTALRGEMRALLRTMKPDERRRLLDSNAAFQRAALEGAPELAGIDAISQRALRERVVAERFPEQVAASNDAIEAVALTKRAIDAAETAARNEIIATGAKIEETPPPPLLRWA